jgi:hypothetical protein
LKSPTLVLDIINGHASTDKKQQYLLLPMTVAGAFCIVKVRSLTFSSRAGESLSLAFASLTAAGIHFLRMVKERGGCFVDKTEAY